MHKPHPFDGINSLFLHGGGVAFIMKNSFLFSLLIPLLISCKTEALLFNVDNSKIGVKHKRVEGTIFNNNYPFANFVVNDVDSTTRWTPNKEEIELAESILRNEIKQINKNRYNQFGRCPVIHRHLNDYFRQYVGIKNNKGQKIIHINFYWNKYSLWERIRGFKDSRPDFNSEYLIVFDGCSYYWQVNVNLDEKSLSELYVNGVA